MTGALSYMITVHFVLITIAFTCYVFSTFSGEFFLSSRTIIMNRYHGGLGRNLPQGHRQDGHVRPQCGGSTLNLCGFFVPEGARALHELILCGFFFRVSKSIKKYDMCPPRFSCPKP